MYKVGQIEFTKNTFVKLDSHLSSDQIENISDVSRGRFRTFGGQNVLVLTANRLLQDFLRQAQTFLTAKL
jgi:hypothetical protein